MKIALHAFEENKKSLKAAVDFMLAISSSEEENLGQINGQDNIYKDESRMVKFPQHSHDFRRKLKSAQDVRDFDSSRFEEAMTRRSSSEFSTKVRSANRARRTKEEEKTKKSNDRSTASLFDDTVFEIPVKHKKITKKARTNSRNDSSRESNNLSYLSK